MCHRYKDRPAPAAQCRRHPMAGGIYRGWAWLWLAGPLVLLLKYGTPLMAGLLHASGSALAPLAGIALIVAGIALWVRAEPQPPAESQEELQ